MKIYAKQVPPEYQESPLYHDDDINAKIFGNRHFSGITSDLFDRLPAALEELLSVWGNMHSGEYGRAVWGEELADVLPPIGREKYTRSERKHDWPRLLQEYDESPSRDKNNVLCRVLEIITGRKWDWCTLRGCCQSDWQYCIYPVNEWNAASLERLEAEYFNTGSEWIVHEDENAPETPEDIDGYSVYCTGWNDDMIRQEIAEAAGGAPEDVTLYKFTGYARRAEYEEVRA